MAAKISNPYKDINWGTFNQYKVNLHSHTTYSDGDRPPHERIDQYANGGYGALSLTDHDTLKPSGDYHFTYPWTALNSLDPGWEDRDPETLDIVSVKGEEVSATRHIGSHYNDYEARGESDEDTVLTAIQNAGGVAQFYHPGRYVTPGNATDIAWYANFYKNYSCLVGLEVFNQVDRYPTDRDFWDDLLQATLPGTMVWGFSNDDTHTDAHLFVSWNLFLASALSDSSIRDCYENGKFLICSKTAISGPEPPEISNISVSGQTITITATGYDTIKWVADGDEVGTSTSLDVSSLKASYVRAELIKTSGGEEGRILTQPFQLGFQGIKVSKPGKDASSTDPRDFTLHSQYNIFKIAEEGGGTATIPVGDFGWDSTITHNLGYKPQVYFFFEHHIIERWILAPGRADHFTTGGEDIEDSVTGWYVNDNNNQTTFFLEYYPEEPPEEDAKIRYKYYIMIEPREDAWYE